jgi:hypothetical protein
MRSLALSDSFADRIKTQSMLEDLPPELRIRIILSLTDFSSLRSLVLASPSYHATYVQETRQQVLCQLALTQMDHRLHPDAFAALRSTEIFERPETGPNEVIAFIAEYGRTRYRGPVNPAPKLLMPFDVTEAINLLHLHESVKLIASDYCAHVSLSGVPGKAPVDHISEMEKLRLHRAIYRFQIYCNLFGGEQKLLDRRPGKGFERGLVKQAFTAIGRFLPSFPPWEVQEIACVWHYLNQRWASILREISDIFFPAPIGSEDMQNDSDMEDVFDYCRFTRHDVSDGEKMGEDERQRYKRYHYEERRDYLAHFGPRLLSRTLANNSLEGRHDATRDIYARELNPTFEENHQYLPIPYDMIGPAAQKYGQNEDEDAAYGDPGVADMHALLSPLPAHEQPSRGWKWFCHKYQIPALGIGWPGYAAEDEHTSGLEPSQGQWRGPSMHMYGAGDELKWGYPFWDKERLEEWGIIMSAPSKKKKKKNAASIADSNHVSSE